MGIRVPLEALIFIGGADYLAYIYKITNDINNKIYIGKTTSCNPIDRWKEHLQEYKRKRCEKRPLYAAMNKYGTEHFHFEVIEETDDPEEREKYWIEKFRTYVGFGDCNGYNATLGGDGKPYLNLNEQEVIQYHIKEASYVLVKTAKHFKVDRDTIKNILDKNNIKILSSFEYSQKYTMQKVCQIDLETNEIINIFDSYADANRYMGKNRKSSVIRMAAYGKYKTAYGYKWIKYVDYLNSYNSA